MRSVVVDRGRAVKRSEFVNPVLVRFNRPIDRPEDKEDDAEEDPAMLLHRWHLGCLRQLDEGERH